MKPPTMKSRLSVIIPTYNGAAKLRELLAAFLIQTRKPDEILVIDSSSTDETVEVAKSHGATVRVIPKQSFDHGGTRTQAARSAHADILIFLTQDVLPAHRQVLEQLIDPLERGDNVVVSYARQLPAFDATDIAAHLRRFNYPPYASTTAFSDRHRLGLRTIFASNSCAAYRREPLEKIGYFPEGLIFGEDTCAVGRLLQAGGKVAYVAAATVYHSHNYSWQEEFKRYFDIGVLHQSEHWLLETYGSARQSGTRYIKSGISYLAARRRYSAVLDFMVRVALKFIGYRLGRHHYRLPRTIQERCSMHAGWWRGQGAGLKKQRD